MILPEENLIDIIDEDIEKEIEKDDEIEQNMLRERKKKFNAITEEEWNDVNEVNRYFYDEYFKLISNKSPKTIIQYKSALKIFFCWVKDYLRNKPVYGIKKSEFKKYILYLMDEGMSSNGIKVKRYVVNSFCSQMELIAEEIDEYSPYQDMEKFKNFSRVKVEIPNNKTYEKIKMTKEELDEIVKKLWKDKDYLLAVYLVVSFNTGARRSEMIQFKVSELDKKFDEEKGFIISDAIRGKGKGKEGKLNKYLLNKDVLKYMKMWVDIRGEVKDSEYIFADKNGRLTVNWVNYGFQHKISPLLGRRCVSHNMKASAITYLLEQGVDMKLVSKYIGHHESIETTQIYDLRNFEKELNGMFKS